MDYSTAQPKEFPYRIRPHGLSITLTKKPSITAQSAKQAPRTIVAAYYLIPGDGDPIPEGALVVEGKTIVWLGKRADIPDKYVNEPHKLHAVPYLMPGLWDCHVHFGGVSETDDDMSRAAALTQDGVSTGARLAKHCWEGLQRGYTSMRDVAGYGCEVAKAIQDGTIVGPNVYSAGAALSQLAGHGDEFSMPAGDVISSLGVSKISPGNWGTSMLCICDGPIECRRAVRVQIRRGAKCIKILASGGVLSTDDNPEYAQFSPEELDAIIDEATRFERTVAAHVHGKAGIIAAVKAGVTSVEHVSIADEECIKLIKEKGTIYVATRTIIDAILQSNGEGLPAKSWEKAKYINKTHMAAYKMAVKAGVTCALGTDLAPNSNLAKELEFAVEAGMTNREAIKAATANGPLTVKGQVGKSGQLKVGYEADMIGVFDDPLVDVRTLQKKDNIAWVWKGGKLYKGPGVGPWGEEETS